MVALQKNEINDRSKSFHHNPDSLSLTENDFQINRLQKELKFLRQKLDEKTHENETLRSTMAKPMDFNKQIDSHEIGEAH